MWLMIALVIVGLLMFVAELVLLPGISVAGFCSLAAYGGAIYIAFDRYGTSVGLIVIAAVVVLSIAVSVLALRANTWKRLSLRHNVDGISQESPESRNVKVGDVGTAVTRLAPMGKVAVNGETYEAKALDSYVDARTKVEVTGFENFSIIVSKTTNSN